MDNHHDSEGLDVIRKDLKNKAEKQTSNYKDLVAEVKQMASMDLQRWQRTQQPGMVSEHMD